MEIEAALKLGNKITLNPNFTFSSNKNKEAIISLDGELVNLGKTNISFSPEFIAANAFVYSPFENLQFSLLSKYVGVQYMGNTDSEKSKLDSYFVNDFNVSYELTFQRKEETKPFIKSILVTGLVNNLFNEKYISNGYYYTYDDTWSNPNQVTTIEGAGYYPQATINFLVGATIKF